MNTWEQLTIYIDESDQWHGKPLFMALVEAARKQGLSGATVIRGVEGYGMRHHHQIHTARIMELADLPVVITVIDTAEAIAQFLPTLQEMVAVGLITQETIHVVHHAPIK